MIGTSIHNRVSVAATSEQRQGPFVQTQMGNQNFSRGGWEVVESDWYLGAAELMGLHTSCRNWRPFLKPVTLEILVISQNRHPNEVSVQSVCLYFCHNIHKIILFFYPCYVLLSLLSVLLQKWGGLLPNPPHKSTSADCLLISMTCYHHIPVTVPPEPFNP